jgi:hypothetical protein
MRCKRMDTGSPINTHNMLRIGSRHIRRIAVSAFFFMVTISTIMYVMLESVRVSELVFLLTLEIAIGIGSVFLKVVPLIAIGLIEIGSLLMLELSMKRFGLLSLSSKTSNLNIFSKNLKYRTGFIPLFLLSVVFVCMIPPIGILISIASVTLIIRYYSEMMRRGLNTYCSAEHAGHVDTYYLQGGL